MRTLFTGLCLLISLTLGAAACNIFPSGPPTWGGSGGGATTSTDATPCGPSPCDDGASGELQDVGEHCAGDDTMPAPPGGYSCCHGLVCQGATATQMGACARPSQTAGQSTCPLVWLYSCDGFFQSKGGVSINWTGTFTGPAPSAVNYSQGLGSWMKIKFFGAYPTIVQGGVTYYYLAAKNCMPLGPYPGP